MLVLRSIKLKNFLSHPETVLEFDGERRVLIDGKSGAGKSAIVEAVIWGLYGKGRADNRFLVRSGEEKGEVELNLFNTDTYYRVTRTVTASGKQAIVIEWSNDGEEFEPVQVTGVKGAQEWIEGSLLHASYTLFINSVAYPQDNSENFVKQSASKRKDLLLEIAGGADFEIHYNRAKDKLALEEEGLARISGRLEDKKVVAKMGEGLPEKIALNQATVERCEASIAEKRKEIEQVNVLVAKAADVTRQIYDKEMVIRRCTETISNLVRGMNEATRKTKEIEEMNLDDLEAKAKTAKPLELKTRLTDLRAVTERAATWQKLMTELMAKKPKERDYTSDIDSLTKQMMQIVRGSDTSCPSLAGKVCERLERQVQSQTAFFEQQISEKRALREQQEKDLATYAQLVTDLGTCPTPDWEQIKAVEEAIAEFNTLKNKIFEVRALKESCANLYTSLAQDKERLEASNKELLEAHKDKAELVKQADTNNLAAIEGRLNVLKSEVVVLERESRDAGSVVVESKTILQMATEALKTIQELEEQASAHKARINALKAVKEAFGSKGIKTVVIDYFVPKLEERINEVLSQLSEFRVEIDTQRGGSDEDSVIEGLFINIIDSRGQTMEFNSYSGGEKLKVIVSISEALSSLQNTGFRILDELFVGLDQESTDGFAEVLGKVQNRFQQMICVSHLQSIKDMFDDRVEVIKLNGSSTLA